jgi:hypothetical protein
MKNQRIANALIAAKDHLFDDNRAASSQFVCVAVSYARAAKKISSEDEETTQRMILQRIAPHNVFERWIAAAIGEDYSTFLKAHTFGEFHQHRLRWVDSMIKEFSE